MADTATENGMVAYLANMQKTIRNLNRKLAKHNADFQVEEDSSTGPRALFTKGNELREAGSANESVTDAYNAYENQLSVLSEFRQAFVNAVASQLGIEAPVERPRPTKEQYDKAKETRSEVSHLLSTLEDIAKFAPTQEDKDSLAKFVEENQPPEKLARPEIERKQTGPSAPKFRVDVFFTDKDGNEHKEAGFTKTDLATGKDGPTAKDLRDAYVAAGGNGQGTFRTEYTHNGVTYTIVNREKVAA